MYSVHFVSIILQIYIFCLRLAFYLHVYISFWHFYSISFMLFIGFQFFLIHVMFNYIYFEHPDTNAVHVFQLFVLLVALLLLFIVSVLLLALCV